MEGILGKPGCLGPLSVLRLLLAKELPPLSLGLPIFKMDGPACMCKGAQSPGEITDGKQLYEEAAEMFAQGCGTV